MINIKVTTRNVEWVMVDRKISRKLKRKVLDSCVVPATYGLETLAPKRPTTGTNVIQLRNCRTSE